MNDSPPPVLACEGLSKRFREGSDAVDVLKSVSLSVARGERIAIVGASGSGKSTLLHLLGGLDAPTAGRVSVNGEDVSRLSDAARGRLRNRALGFVYQFHHLLPEFSALENVAMPLYIRRMPRAEADADTAEPVADGPGVGGEVGLVQLPRAVGRRRCLSGWAWVIGPVTPRGSSRGASASVPPLPGPW